MTIKQHQAVERLGLDAKKLSGIPYARSVYKEVGFWIFRVWGLRV